MNDFELVAELTNDLFAISGLEPPRAELKLDVNAKDDLNLDLFDEGLDAMGIYSSASKRMTLFERSISRCAQKCPKCDRSVLRLIVIIHEAAHFVTHTGLLEVNGNKLDWKKFPEASRQEKEASAQSATRLLLADRPVWCGFEPSQLLEPFDDLTAVLPEWYRVWTNQTNRFVNKQEFRKRLYQVSDRVEVNKGGIKALLDE